MVYKARKSGKIQNGYLQSMKPIVIIGGGGHAQSIVAMLESSVEMTGYADNKPSEAMSVKYLGTDDDVLSRFSPADCDICLGIGFDPGCSLSTRRKVSEKYKGYSHATLVAPSAWIARGASLGDGSVIMARAVVNRCNIGRDAVVNTGAIVEHGCTIGDNVFIGPGAVVCGEVVLGNDVFIGAGAVVRQGLVIQSGVIVGMGSVVVSSLESAGVYAGNPAKRIK